MTIDNPPLFLRSSTISISPLIGQSLESVQPHTTPDENDNDNGKDNEKYNYNDFDYDPFYE